MRASRRAPESWLHHIDLAIDEVRLRHGWWFWSALLLATGGVAYLGYLAGEPISGELVRLQLPSSATQLRDGVDAVGGVDAVLDHLDRDRLFIVAYFLVAQVWVAFAVGRRLGAATTHLAHAFTVALAIADAFENRFMDRAMHRLADPEWSDIRDAARIKWGLVVVLVLLPTLTPYVEPPPGARRSTYRKIVHAARVPMRDVPLLRRPFRRIELLALHLRIDEEKDPEQPIDEILRERWTAPSSGDRVGISCSGGGIRSASFALGALHGLGPKVVRSATYLSAVSGGSWIASAMTAHAVIAVDVLRAQTERVEALYFKLREIDRLDLWTSLTLMSADELWTHVRQNIEAARRAERLRHWRRRRTLAAAATIAWQLEQHQTKVKEALLQFDPAAPDLPFGQHASTPTKVADDRELSRLRARSSYLDLAGASARISLARTFSFLALNLLILWLGLFVVARPIGWTVSWLHPELRATTPLRHDVALEDELEPDDFVIADAGASSCDGDVEGRQLTVATRTARRLTFDFATDAMSSVRHDAWRQPSHDAYLATEHPGLIELCDGQITTLRKVDFWVVDGPSAAATKLEEIELIDSPDIELDSDAAVSSSELSALLEVNDQPRFAPVSGTRGREAITIGWQLWTVVGVSLVGLATSLLLNRKSLQGVHGGTRGFSPISSLFAWAASLTLAIGIAAPWLVQTLPSWSERISDALPSGGGIEGFVIGIAGVLATTKRLFTKAQTGPAAAAGKPRSKLMGSVVTKVVATVGLVVAGVFVLLRILQYPVLNGPTGRLGGFESFWWSQWRPADWVPAAIALVVLLYARLWFPAHMWSLNPLFRDRLATGFLGDDRDGPICDAVSRATIHDAPPPGVAWPQLVVCGAINLNSLDPENRIPTGRWADSFTFSREAVGSPSTGYLPTDEYDRKAIGRSRRGDLRYASLMAISGAAFSPAMGKEAKGAMGGVFAVLNLRLGMWLPNPMYVRHGVARWSIAGWPYLWREIFGQFRRRAPFVYVTDGGHWENLGLVELIRRGCTDIYVLSAAGDKQASFATMGEAIALAREQFGVDIEVELSPMRPQPSAEVKPGARVLLRGDPPVPAPVSRQPFAVGWFEYPDGGPRARILFIEATLTDALPWDVHAHAESNPEFPDDSTANQLFNHRQFESYRRLGLQQADAGISSEAWSDAGLWRAHQIDEDQLRERLSRV